MKSGNLSTLTTLISFTIILGIQSFFELVDKDEKDDTGKKQFADIVHEALGDDGDKDANIDNSANSANHPSEIDQVAIPNASGASTANANTNTASNPVTPNAAAPNADSTKTDASAGIIRLK